MQNLIGGKLQPVMPGRTFGPVGPTTGIEQVRSLPRAARVPEGRPPGGCRRGHTSMIRREPIRVRVQLTHWNSPRMAARKCCRASPAGNTIATDHGTLNDVNQHERVQGLLEGRPDHVEAAAGGSSMVGDTHIPIEVEKVDGGFEHSGHGRDHSMYSLGDHTRIERVESNLDVSPKEHAIPRNDRARWPAGGGMRG